MHVFYAKNDGKAGTFYWCEPGKQVADPKRRLPLHEVTDIFLGKQTPVFQHEVAASAVEDRCFSIMGAKYALHLECETSEQLTTWLYGLDKVLTSSGKKFVLDEEVTLPVSPEAAQRRFSVVNSQAAVLPREKVPATQMNARAVQEMIKGSEFISYENTVCCAVYVHTISKTHAHTHAHNTPTGEPHPATPILLLPTRGWRSVWLDLLVRTRRAH
jgi:hypothetical protein